MYLAGGIIAPEELVSAVDCFSGQHLPGGAAIASAGRRTEVGDGRHGGANADVAVAGAVSTDEAGVAL